MNVVSIAIIDKKNRLSILFSNDEISGYVGLTTIFPVKVTLLCGFYRLNHLLVELAGRRNSFDQQNGCNQKRTGKDELHLGELFRTDYGHNC